MYINVLEHKLYAFVYFTLFVKHTYFLTSRLHIGACIVLYRESVNNHQTNKTAELYHLSVLSQ